MKKDTFGKSTDKYGNPLQNYTKLTSCTPYNQEAPQCPEGWESVGKTPIGSCLVSNVSGDNCDPNPNVAWNEFGYNRVCKRKVPTSGDAGVDCCSNLFGIANSLECQKKGFVPYSEQCNNIMLQKCNTNNQQKDPLGPNWNGIPLGQDHPVYLGCKGYIQAPGPSQKPGCMDEFCINYLRNAPPNNFFYEHDYQDYPYYFPRYSYTTPQFSAESGYYPARTSYYSYRDFKHKGANNYCLEFPNQCWNEFPPS